MPTWKVRYDADRKYRASWSKDFPWISKTRDGSENAFCSICNRTMKPKMSVLLIHSQSRGHVAKSASIQPSHPTDAQENASCFTTNDSAAHQHLSELVKCLLKFQKERFLCDVTLVAKDGRLKAHGAVLAASSNLLRRTLSESVKSVERVLLLPWLEFYELEIVIEFIYTGRVVVSSRHANPEKLQRVMWVLKELGLKLPTVQSLKNENQSSSAEVITMIHVKSDGDSSTVLPSCSEDQSTEASSTDQCQAVGVVLTSFRQSTSEGVPECDIKISPIVEAFSPHESEAMLDIVADSSSAARAKRGRPRREDFSVSTSGDGGKALLCDTCGKECTTSMNLETHMRTHTGECPYTCNECGRSFRHKVNLQRHQKVHTGEKPHICELCGFGFIQNVMLIDHRSRHHLETVDLACAPFLCRMCGQRFLTTHRLRTHKATAHRRLQRSVKRKVIDGIARSSSGEGSFECEQCNELFVSKVSLSLHMRRHVDKKPLECTVCSCAFDEQTELDDHMQRHMSHWPRTAARDAIGEGCLVVTTSGGDGPESSSLYECTVCGKQVKQLAHLKSHMLMHTGERPFRCPLCEKAYRSRFDLRLHCTRIHSIDLPSGRLGHDVGASATSCQSELEISQGYLEIKPM